MKFCNLIVSLIFCLTLSLLAVPNASVAAQAAADSASVMSTVSINTADEAMLTQIPGVGPKTAAEIISHRKDIGKFTTLEQLTDVKGIGEKKLEKMRPYLTL